MLCIPLAGQAIDSSSGKTRTMTKEVLESDVGGSCQENLLLVFSFQPVGYVDGHDGKESH